MGRGYGGGIRPGSGPSAASGSPAAFQPGSFTVNPGQSCLPCRLPRRATLPAGQRADALLEEFCLADRAKDKPDFFSGGQAQRVMIARALMHAPHVLFLDEPSTRLNPAARLFVWDRLRALKEAEG